MMKQIWFVSASVAVAMGDGGAVNMECTSNQKSCPKCGCCQIAQDCRGGSSGSGEWFRCGTMPHGLKQPGVNCGNPGASLETVKSNMESVDDNSTMV